MNTASLLDAAQRALAVAVRWKSEAHGYLFRLPGFSFDEKMSGLITLQDHPHPQHIEFRIHAQAVSIGSFLEEGRTDLTGTVMIADFADSCRLTGSLWIRPREQTIRYEFQFPDNQGAMLHFAGQKDVSLLDLRHTMSFLPGFLYDRHGKELGQAEVRFDWADLPSFLASFRPTLPRTRTG